MRSTTLYYITIFHIGSNKHNCSIAQRVLTIRVTWRCLVRDRNCLHFPSSEMVLLFFLSFLCCIFVLCLSSAYLVCPTFQVSLGCPFILSLRFSLTFIQRGNMNCLPFGRTQIIPCFSGVRVSQSLVFCVVFCRTLFF